MATWSYPATFTTHNNGEIVVRFVDLPEVITAGWSETEAFANAADALDVGILGRLSRSEEIPQPCQPEPGERPVPLNPITAARCEFMLQLKHRQLSKVAAAKVLRKDEKVVRRILDGEGRVSAANVLEGLKEFDLWPALTFSGAARCGT